MNECATIFYEICFVYMSSHLKISGFSGDETVDGHHQDHDCQSCQDRRAYLQPQEHDGQADLQGAGPQQVDEVGHVVEALGVCRHQVHRFPHGRLFTSVVGDQQCLGTGKREAYVCDPFRKREIFLERPQ